MINISYVNTRLSVEKYITNYKYFLLSLTHKEIPYIENYKLIYNSKNFENPKLIYKEKYVMFFNQVINDLELNDRIILISTYFLGKNQQYIADTLGYNRTYYFVIKKKTIIKLAYSLNIEVLDEKLHTIL